MSAVPSPTTNRPPLPRAPRPAGQVSRPASRDWRTRERVAAGGDWGTAVRRIAGLLMLSFGVGAFAGPFAGIVLFVAGLAAVAAYAAAHPPHA